MIRPATPTATRHAKARHRFGHPIFTVAAALMLAACGDASQPGTAMNAGDIPENQGTRQGTNGNAGADGPVVRQSPEPTGNPAGAQGYPATGRP